MASPYVIHPADCWRLCNEAAISIYGKTPPNERYAANVARLLFGTIAQESGFRWVRQTVFRANSYWVHRGAFGIAQCEPTSIKSSLDYLSKRIDVAERVAAFAFNDVAAGAKAFDMDVGAMLRLIVSSHRAAIALCRVHYLWFTPTEIPVDLDGQAAYWKRYYNTVAGAGTVEEYKRNWARFASAGGVA